MTINCILPALLLLFALSAADAARKETPIYGGWTPIKNINDPHVTEIADFAVTEYDRRSGAKLKLDKVIKGDTKVVSGTDYRLVISAFGGSGSSAASNYEAIVWEKPWLHYKNLTSFNPV